MSYIKSWSFLSVALVLSFSIFCRANFLANQIKKKFNKQPSLIQIGKDTLINHVDRFIGEEFHYTCSFGKEAVFKFESHGYPIVRKVVHDTDDYRVSFIVTYDEITLKLTHLELTDSGTYICVINGTIFSTDISKLAVHDPNLFLWTFSDRGMKPTRDIEIGRTRAVLRWSEWLPCDGCAGKGERRRFGFCYVKAAKKGQVQCTDRRKLSASIRPFAKRKKNEILVETCYEECDDDEDMFEPDSSLSFLAEQGDDLDIVCPGNISTRTSVRWERQFDTMQRKDFSFGYGPAKPYFITRRNSLQIHKINFGGEKRITITCVVWRQRRHDFVINLLPKKDKIATMIEHLRVMAISCSIQFVLFLVIVLIVDCTKAFAESISLNRQL